MTRIKIIDSTTHIGAAERHLILRPDFKRFLRNKYGVDHFKLLDPIVICKKYKLKGFVFGNYVTQEERYYFLFKVSKQLELLAKIKGSNDLGGGVLTIGFGADGRPKANAHYNPEGQFINLNRGRKSDYKNVLKGESSFVHEYGHFLDFIQGRSDLTTNVNFASQTIDAGQHLLGVGTIKASKKPATKRFVALTQIATNNKKYMDGLKGYKNANYLKLPWEIFARMFETTITRMSQTQYKDYEKYLDPGRYKSNYYLSTKEIDNSPAKQLVKAILKGR